MTKKKVEGSGKKIPNPQPPPHGIYECRFEEYENMQEVDLNNLIVGFYSITIH